MLAPWKKSYDKPRQCIKKQRCHFADKGPSSQSFVFASSHVWIWELNHKEGWGLKNRCFQTGCWRRVLRVPWTARRLNQSILKEINPEYSSEELMLKLKCQYSSHLMQSVDSLGPWAGKDWRQKEKGAMEYEMVAWHHWLNGNEFEQAPWDGGGHGRLACCSPWSCRVRHDLVTEQQPSQQAQTLLLTPMVWTKK